MVLCLHADCEVIAFEIVDLLGFMSTAWDSTCYHGGCLIRFLPIILARCEKNEALKTSSDTLPSI